MQCEHVTMPRSSAPGNVVRHCTRAARWTIHYRIFTGTVKVGNYCTYHARNLGKPIEASHPIAREA
jgi:hypothetical protein